MKKKIILISSIVGSVLLIALTITLICVLKPSKKSDSYRTIKIFNANGTVTYKRDNKTNSVVKGMNLKSNDYLSTATKSNATLKLDSDKYIYAEEKTNLKIVSDGKDKYKTRIELEEGGVISEVKNKLTEGESFDIASSNSVIAIRGTQFSVFMNKTTSKTDITYMVYSGKVSIYMLDVNDSNKAYETNITTGNKATLTFDNSKIVTTNTLLELIANATTVTNAELKTIVNDDISFGEISDEEYNYARYYIDTFADNENNYFEAGLTISDVQSDVAPNPQAKAHIGTVIYKYSTSENGTYSTTIPTTPGKYYCKAYVEGEYPLESEPQSFNIIKKETPVDPADPTDPVVEKYTLSITQTVLNSGITNSGAGVYATGDTVNLTITITPTEYTFAGWYDGDTLLSKATTYSYTMPKRNVDIVAKIATVDKQGLIASNGVLTSFGDANSSEIIIPATDSEGNPITSIGKDAFKGYTALTAITLPDTITEISDGAFSGCTALETINIPSGCKTIGIDAFSGCSNLQTIEFNKSAVAAKTLNPYVKMAKGLETSSLKTIGKNAFANCYNLRTTTTNGVEDELFTLPDSVEFVHPDAFICCTSITFKSERISGELDYFYKYIGTESNPYYFLYSIDNLNGYNVSLRDDIKVIGNSAVKGTLTSSTNTSNYLVKNENGNYLPSGLIAIGDYAFYSKRTFKVTTTLPETVKYVGELAFGNVYQSGTGSKTNLNATFNIVIPENNSLEYVGASAFYMNTAITTLYLNSTIKELSPYAFAGCSGLTEVVATGFETIDGIKNCTSLTKVTLIDVDEIAANAFSGCTSLTTVSQTNLKKIGSKAFDNCSSDIVVNVTEKIELEPIALLNVKGYTYDEDGIYLYVGSATNKYHTLYKAETKDVDGIAINPNTEVIYNNAFTYYSGTTITTLTIPKNVTKIGDYAFNGVTITNLVFEEGSKLKSIGYRAFASANIETISKISDNLETIGEDAFSNSKFTQIELPSSLKKIDTYAFQSSAITSITIPKNVEFGKNVFMGSALEEITFASGTKEIPAYVCQGAYSLKTVNLNGAEIIGEYAFVSCNKLTNVDLTGVKEIKSNAFYGTNALSTITIPNTVTTLGDYAFAKSEAYNYTIYNVLLYFEEGCKLTELPNYCFANCNIGKDSNGDKLDSYILTIPNTIKKIGNYAFSNTKLTSLSFEDDSVLEYIGNRAFGNIYGITSYSIKTLSLPDSVKYIGAEAFFWHNISSLSLPNNIEYIGSYAFNNIDTSKACSGLADGARVLTNRNGDPIIYFEAPKFTITTDYEIPEGVLVINSSAFSTTQAANYLRSVKIPSSVTIIGEQAFSGCKALETVTGIENVTEIQKNAFQSCYLLNSITLGNKLEKIGESAFYSCKALEKIEIPNTVTSIGESAFNSCYSLKEVVLSNKITELSSHLFYQCYSLRTINIPDKLETIGTEAFCHCYKLTNLVLPSTLKSVGYNAFLNNYALTEVINYSNQTDTLGDTSTLHYGKYAVSIINLRNGETYTSNMIYDGDYIFYYDNLNNTYYLVSYIGNETTITLPDVIEGVEKDYIIKKGAFAYEKQLETINISDNVTKIDDYAFYQPNSYTEYTIRNINISDTSKIESIGKYAFNYSSISTINIPDSCLTISDYAFNYAKITEAKIKDTSALTTIGPAAFAYTTKLESFYIPKNVTNISKNAFTCSYVKYVKLDKDSKLSTTKNLLAGNSLSYLEKIELPLIDCDSVYYAIYYYEIASSTPKYSITSLKEIVINGGVVSNKCFEHNTSYSSNMKIEKITITEDAKLQTANTLTTDMFAYVETLKELHLGSREITKIEANAFRCCTNLTTVDFTVDASNIVPTGNLILYSIMNIKVNIVDENGCLVSGAGTYDAGATPTIVAKAKEGYYADNIYYTYLGSNYSFYLYPVYENTFEITATTLKYQGTSTNGMVADIIITGVNYFIRTYLVDFYVDGNVASESNYTINTSVSSFADPKEKEHYVFAGWYDNEEFTGSPVTSIPVGTTGDKNFYAKFEKKEAYVELTINESKYGSATVVGGEVQTPGSTVTIKATPKAGKSFAGWYDSNDNLVSTDLEYSFTMPEISIDCLYVAKFEKVSDAVTVDFKESNSNIPLTEELTPTVSINGVEYKVGEGLAFTEALEATITVNFDHLALNSSYCFVRIYKGTSTYSVTSKNYYNTDDTYNFTYTFTTGSDYRIEVQAKRAEYTLQFYINEIYTDYVSGYGTVESYKTLDCKEDIFAYLKPSISLDSLSGYSLVGFKYKDTNEDVTYPLVITSNTTLVAVYELDAVAEYTITYNTNGGTAVENSTYTFNSEYTAPVTTKEGYVLYGWYLDSDFEELVDDYITSGKLGLNGNQTFYARWIKDSSVNINLNGGNHLGDTSNITIKLSDFAKYGKSVTSITSSDIINILTCHIGVIKSNSAMSYIAYDADGEYNFYSKEILEDIDLYIIWEETNTLIVYTNGGNTPSFDAPVFQASSSFLGETVTYEMLEKVFAKYVNNDYVFDGFYTDKEFTNKFVSATTDADIIVYMKWVEE